MLEPLFGSVNRERVLTYLYARGEAYPREIARFYKTDLAPIKSQLEKLESGGVVSSRLAGKTRLYTFDPRYTFLDELKKLMEKALSFYSDKDKEALLMVRHRPRRKGKPL